MNIPSLLRPLGKRTLAAAGVASLAISLGAVMARGYGAFVPYALRAQAGASALVVRSPKGGEPTVNLHDGRQVAASYSGGSAAKGAVEDGRAKPLALAAYDFDADGAVDVVAGYAVNRGGAIAVHRGDPSVYGPTDPEMIRRIANGHYPDPFLRDVTLLDVPEQPDFLATGDVDRDGFVDVVAATRGSRTLYIFAGDGRGGFAAARSMSLPGDVTALVAGDVGVADGRTDLVIGVSDGGRHAVYVYDGPAGALGAPPAIDVDGEVTSIAVAVLDDDAMADVAIVAGGDLFVARNGAPAPAPARVAVPVQAVSVVAGEFVGDRDARLELAVLGVDGAVSVLARDDLDTRPMTHDEIVARRLANLTPAAPAAKAAGTPPSWRVAETVASVAKAARAGSGAAQLVRAHVSTEAAEDLLVVDPTADKIHVLSAPTVAGKDGELSFASEPRTDVALDVSGAPAAALAMRVGVDGRQGIVLLGQGGSAPAVVFPKVAATFTVNKAADTNDGTCDADCSLREAVGAANASAGADMIVVPAGTYTLTRAGRDENANSTGDLDVTGAATIMGAGAATTIIQAGTTSANGIDKVLSFNPAFTTPFATSLTGLTIQNGFNTSSPAGDGFGGAFDQEFNATGSMTITNCVIQTNTTQAGPGGAIAFTSSGGSGTLTLTGTTISSNVGGSTFGGGGVWNGQATALVATNSTISNNQASNANGNGGGILLIGGNGTTPTALHNCQITGNSSGTDGGGIYSTQSITLNQSSDILSNTAGRNGGGVWLNHTNLTSTIDHCTFRLNAATTGAGGAVRLDSATTGNVLNMSFCRIVDNTATSATGLSVLNGTATAENNWWGCNEGPTNAACDTAIESGSGALDFDPWIVLTVTASPTSVFRGQTSTLSASFLMNSAGQTLTTAQISELIGLPVAWSATGGTISAPENSIQSDGMANATYTGTTIGAGTATATVDSYPASVNITVLNNPPTITAAGPLTRQRGSAGTSSQIATVSDLDQAANTLTVTATPPAGITVTGIAIDAAGNVTATVTASCTATLGANTVPLTVMDSNGGSASANLTVNVTANTPPTLGTYPNTSVAAGGNTTVTPSAAPTDNGSVASVTAVATTPAGFTGTLSGNATTGVITVTNANPPAVYTITVTATDNCGATSTTTFQLTVVPPCTVTCPANVTASNNPGVCGAVVTYSAPTTTGTCGTVTCAPASGSLFAVGVTTVTCTASAGPSCTFTVTVNDTQAPTVTCPANVTQPATAGTCTRTVTYTTPTASDNCPGATVVCAPASGSTFPRGVTTVTCTATDAASNTGSCTFTVTITDTQAPTITCPANVTQSATSGACSATVTYTTPTATDNCSGVGTVTCTPASGSTFVVGTTTVTCSVTDASSNPASCTFTVTVNDTQAPTLTCPANITQPAAAGVCTRTVTYTTPTASDNCSGATVVCAPASGSTFARGVTTVTCTATDASSNTASCTFTVTIVDNQAPTVTCPPNQTAVESPAQSGSATVTYPAPTVSDNCPGATVACVPASGSSFPVGVTTVTCTATDASSNTGSCTFTVTVTPACTISCPANVTTGNSVGQCGAVVNYAAPTTTGNCGTITCAPASGSFFPKGTTTVTCTTTTGPSCSFTVTVNDTEAPLVSCPKSPMANTSPGQCSAPVTYSVTATDNCPGVTLVCVPASGSTFPVGMTSVTCTATDTSSNTASCGFTVRVLDAQVPTITCPANVSTPAAAGQCSAAVTYGAPTAADNCGIASVACTPASGSTFPIGTTTVTCTATDTSGNTASCGFTVTVVDTQAPTIVCPSTMSSKANARGANDCSLTGVVTYPAPTVTDNCPGATVACVPASGSVFPEGTTTVTCTATDGSGNAASCSFTVTVSVAFGVCVVDDASGDTFSIVTAQNDPLYGLWRYRVAATGQVFCGTASSLSYIPNRSLVASDNDDPAVTMQATINFSSSTATVQVRDRSTNHQYVLRDRNLRNDPACQ